MRDSVRQRLYPTLPSSPLDSWCVAGLLTLAISGGIACALWLFGLGEVPFGWSLILPFALLGGPQLTRLPLPSGFHFRHHRSLSQLWVLLIAVAFGTLHDQATLGVWGVFLLLGVHGFALRYSRPDHLASMALLIPLIEMLFANAVLWPMGLVQRIVIAVWMLLTVLIAAGVATWLHARWARRHLRLDRHRYDNEAETGEGLWERARLMLIVGLILTPFGLLLQQGSLFAAKTLRPIPTIQANGSNQVGGSNYDSSLESNQDSAEGASNTPTIRRAEIADLTMPSAIAWQGKIAGSGRERPILHVKTDQDSKGQGRYHSTENPLYLLATTFDTIDSSGLHRSPSSEVVHYANDTAGKRDWIVFDPDLIQEQVIKYKILQRVLFNDNEGVKGTLSYLLHSRRLVALKADSCRLDDDGTALGDPGADDLLSYQWWAEGVHQDLQLQTSAEARYLALPTDLAFQEWIFEARFLCADLKDPEEILQRVVEHFQTNFQYDLEPSQSDGIQAFTDFFNNKRGYCSYFASAGMLYLRANGIPARVASGFLISEYSKTEEAYVGRLSDAHAWLEVQQVDGSWRTIDPTPASQRNSLLAALQTDSTLLNPEANEETTDPLAPDAEAQEDSLKAAVKGSGFGIHDFVFILATVVSVVTSILILGNVFAKRAKRKWSKDHGLSPDAENALDYWLRVRELLVDLGFKVRRSQSAAEFCQTVQHWGGEFYKPLNSVTMLVYRARFGGYSWSEREQAYLEQYEEMLEKKLRESG